MHKSQMHKHSSQMLCEGSTPSAEETVFVLHSTATGRWPSRSQSTIGTGGKGFARLPVAGGSVRSLSVPGRALAGVVRAVAEVGTGLEGLGMDGQDFVLTISRASSARSASRSACRASSLRHACSQAVESASAKTEARMPMPGVLSSPSPSSSPAAMPRNRPHSRCTAAIDGQDGVALLLLRRLPSSSCAWGSTPHSSENSEPQGGGLAEVRLCEEDPEAEP